jgi:4-hydroxybenzoate polyprenyltransferase
LYINILFMVIIIIYLILNFLYSLKLKEEVIIDVMLIATGFVLRAVAGGVAIGVTISHWLILCTFLLSLLLGFGKRRGEINQLGLDAEKHRNLLGKYTVTFLDQMMMITAALTIITYAFYTVSTRTITAVGSESLIYTTFFVIYGIGRYIYVIQVVGQEGDPTTLFFKDKPIILVVLLWLIAVGVILYLL